MGLLTGNPHPAMTNDISNWITIVARFGDKLIIVTPSSDTNDPQKNQYNRQNKYYL